MYLTAHRVRRPTGPEEGVNAFFYVHGPTAWEGLPPEGIPDEEPGELVNSRISVQPPGNRVRSYLDIVAPDGTPWAEIGPAFIAFVSEAQVAAMPWRGIVGRCFFRVGMDAALAADWQRELLGLYNAAEIARVDRDRA
jgi:hypothetical protein